MSAFGSGSCSRDDRPVVDIEHRAFQFLSDCARSGDELGRPFSEFFGLPKAPAQYVPHPLHDVTTSRGHQPGFRNPRWLNVSLMGGQNAAILVQHLPITRAQWTRGGKSKLMSSFPHGCGRKPQLCGCQASHDRVSEALYSSSWSDREKLKLIFWGGFFAPPRSGSLDRSPRREMDNTLRRGEPDQRPRRDIDSWQFVVDARGRDLGASKTRAVSAM